MKWKLAGRTGFLLGEEVTLVTSRAAEQDTQNENKHSDVVCT